MSVTIVVCPECQAKLKVSGAVAPGKKIRCPKCQATFAVPAEDEAPPLEESVTARPVKARRAPPPDVEDEEDDVLPPRRPAKRQPVEEEEDDEPGPVWRRHEEDEDEEDRPARRTARGRDTDDEDEEEDRPRRRKPTKRSKAKGNPALLWSLIGGGAVVLAGGVVVLILLLNKGDDKSPEGKRPPPDAAALEQLGPEQVYKGFHFRPPKGYKEAKMNARGQEVLGFAGPSRPDGSSPVFLISTIPIPADRANLSKEKLFNDGLAGAKLASRQTMPDMNNGEIERVTINGLVFLRTQIRGTASLNNLKVKGYFYLYTEGQTGLMIFWFDAENNYPTSSKVLDAAALSLKKS